MSLCSIPQGDGEGKKSGEGGRGGGRKGRGRVAANLVDSTPVSLHVVRSREGPRAVLGRAEERLVSVGSVGVHVGLRFLRGRSEMVSDERFFETTKRDGDSP